MREFTTTMTERGQVTVPAEVRRLLGLKPRSKLTFRVDENGVRLVPAAFTIQTAFASVRPLSEPEDFKEISRQAREEHVERTIRKMQDQ